MRILITNDDGIEAEGLQVLVEFARTLGEVFVCAPKTQQSGTSQAVVFTRPVEILPATLPYAPEIPAYRVDSTPADCVRIAYFHLDWKPDLVFSGINRGLNMGEDIGYSGTNGAIFEAAYEGVPAIAFSTVPHSFEWAGGNIARVWDFVREKKLFDFGRLFNVNIPEDPAPEILITRQGGPYYKDSYHHIGNGLYEAHGYSVHHNGGNLELDTDATLSGFITVTPLTTVRTDWKAYDLLRGLNDAAADGKARNDGFGTRY